MSKIEQTSKLHACPHEECAEPDRCPKAAACVDSWGYVNAHVAAQPSVPDGWKLVPVEPTPKMVDATWNHPVETDGLAESHNTRNKRVYSAMLAAAPTPPADGRYTLICPKCQADRTKEDCKGNRMDCGISGIAQADRQAQQDLQTSDAANIEHAEQCTDDDCDRCNALLEFYMVCDKCGRIGNKDASGWAKVEGQFFCERCAQQDADNQRQTGGENEI